MPYTDPERERTAARERKRRWRKKKHAAKYGVGAGSQRGRHGKHATGVRHGRWNDGRLITSHGYIAVRIPANHPHAWGAEGLRGHRYAYEHVVVMVRHIGRPLASGEIVHHLNGDQTDNRLKNLRVMTQSEHMRLHNRERKAPIPDDLLIREMPRSVESRTDD